MSADTESETASSSQIPRMSGSATHCEKAKDFVELHDQVATSINLLDSLEGFLSTFQKDLSAVSGQISDLQDRSKEIESKLKARRKIEKPLSGLLSDICITPNLASVILDTDVGEPWILTIEDFGTRLDTLKARKRVRAARDLVEMAEGLRIVAATKIRAFFLALLQPIRTSMTTNMQVLQTSILVKYRALYTFLQHHAPDVAKEIRSSYTAAARVYYETGFRRYLRSLGWVKARTTDKFESIVVAPSDKQIEISVNEQRLNYSKLDGPAVTLAYQAEEKAHTEPIESLFRSMLLVLMDNATAEYTFLYIFFSEHTTQAPPLDQSVALSPTGGMTNFDRRPSAASEFMSPLRKTSFTVDTAKSKEDQAALNSMWKQIMEPTLYYCQTFADTVIDSNPPVVPLLTMIRLTEEAMVEIQKREASALENFVFGVRLKMWPIFQKHMADDLAGVNKLAESATAGYFKRATPVTNALVQTIVNRYIVLFTCCVILTEKEDDTVVFSNLLKLRQEVAQLIITQAKKIPNQLQAATYQSVMFDSVLQAFSKGQLPTTHPKAQAEMAFWRQREEEARRRMTSTRPNR